MPNNQQSYFCQELTDWLHTSEWHFTTLLAICIDSVKNLPDDADNFINCLLLSFPERPPYHELRNHVNNSTIIDKWFRHSSVKPSIISYNLQTVKTPPRIDSEIPQLVSLSDLACWLSISTAQLEWLTDLKRINVSEPGKYQHYHYSLVEKRRGGKRLIESPKSLLKDVQRIIYSGLLKKTPVHSAAHGFRQNHSCLTHAKNHVNQQYLFTYDIANCFHSIDWYRVYKVFRGLAYPDDVTKYLSGLCTSRFKGTDSILIELDDCQRKKVRKRHLAQGAPTSPVLSNIVLHRLDNRLDGLARKLDLRYSRYADDLAFSGNKHRDWRFFEPLIGSICLEEGFELNHRKSRIVRSHQRQKVTGVIVNQGINVDRRYFDQLKAVLTNCIRHGVEDQITYQHDDFSAHLLGRIMFVNSLNKNRGQKLLSLYRQINFS